jgi:zinc protease
MSAPAVQLPPLSRERLPNGLTVLVVERRSLPLVTMRLTLRAGGAQEPHDLPGLSTLTARMLRKGAGERDAAAWAEALDALGGLFGSGTGLDHVAVDAEFTSRTIDEGLELVIDALRRPRFDAAEFEREIQRTTDEVRQARDDTDEIAEEAFLHALFRDHPFGRCAVGSVRALERLRIEDVRHFHGEHWPARGGVLVVVGDVDAKSFLVRLKEALGDWAGDAPEPPLPPVPQQVSGRPVLLVNAPGSRQVQVRMGSVGVERLTPHWFPLQVANTIFGGGFTSRLVDRIRVEEGLTYSISSRFMPGRVPGLYMISTFTENQELERLHGLITGLLADFRKDGPTPEEVLGAQAFLAGMQPRRIETPGGLALALGEAELNGLGIHSLTDYRREIEAVRPEDAAAAARDCLPEKDLLTVLVGDAEELAEAASRLGDLTVVELDYGESALGLPPAGDET